MNKTGNMDSDMKRFLEEDEIEDQDNRGKNIN